MSRAVKGVALAAVVLVHGLLLWIYWQPQSKTLWGDEAFYAAAAKRLLAGQGSGLDLLWPPLYPYFLAGLTAPTGGSLWLVQLAQTLLLVAVALLTRSLARRLLGPGPAGDVAAFLLLAYPPLVAFAHYLWPEVLHLTLLTAAAWILTCRRRQPAWLAVLGLLLGLALLTKSLLGPFLPVLLLPLWIGERQRPPAQRLAHLALVLAVIAAAVAPAVVRNYRQHGVAVIADSSRFNLWVGLNDTSRRNFVDQIVGNEYETYRNSAPTFKERNALLTEKIRRLVADKGLPAILRDQLSRQYFRLFDKDSFLTDQLPGGPIAARNYGYWGPPSWATALLRISSYGLWALLLVGAAFGLAAAQPRRQTWWWLVFAFLAYNLALLLVLHVKTRYRIQLLPLFAFLTGQALQRWLPGPWRTEPPPGPTRLALGSVLAATALYLAFGG